MPTVRLPHEDELLSHAALSELARFYIMVGKSRREFATWLASEIFLFKGEMVDADGAVFELDDVAIDEAFNNDGSFRWLSDFRQFASRPPKQVPQRRVIPRLQLIALAREIYRINNEGKRIIRDVHGNYYPMHRMVIFGNIPKLPKIAIMFFLRWL